MISIPSENPPGDTRAIASFIKSWLKDYGSTVEACEPKNRKVSLVAKTGKDVSPSLILNGHMDVVPAGDQERWKLPPFCGEIREGRIHGRGATDMKGGLTSIMVAFVAFLNIAEDLPGRLVLNAVSDEETGGLYGSKWCLDNGKVQGDACLIGEPTGTINSFLGEKGVCWLRLSAKGVPAHGSLPMMGENAIEKLVRTFPAVRRLEEEKISLPDDISEAVEISKEFYTEMAKGKGFSEAGILKAVAKAIDHCTTNIGTIRGGLKTNIVPESCVAEVDIRVPAGMTSEKVKARLLELLEEAGLTGIECELVLSSDPNYTATTEKIYTDLKDNVEDISGVVAAPLLVTGGTDGRYFRLKNIPTVIYGPGEITMAHSYNEYVLVDDIITAAKVIANTATDFLLSQTS
jgi:succinyl-diaminopimelate desuccinylase